MADKVIYTKHYLDGSTRNCATYCRHSEAAQIVESLNQITPDAPSRSASEQSYYVSDVRSL